ncbi:hypothetical protein KIL84_010782, partial [Mauremys mutica]
MEVFGLQGEGDIVFQYGVERQDQAFLLHYSTICTEGDTTESCSDEHTASYNNGTNEGTETDIIGKKAVSTMPLPSSEGLGDSLNAKVSITRHETTVAASTGSTAAAGKARGKAAPGDSAVKQVQIDGLVVLKIIKHYQEEGQGNEVVQGVLLGLVVDDRLEITNCFPFPQHTEDDADFDE